MPTIRLTEDEAELTILALEEFKREKLADYDPDDRPKIIAELASATKKLRDAN